MSYRTHCTADILMLFQSTCMCVLNAIFSVQHVSLLCLGDSKWKESFEKKQFLCAADWLGCASLLQPPRLHLKYVICTIQNKPFNIFFHFLWHDLFLHWWGYIFLKLDNCKMTPHLVEHSGSVHKMNILLCMMCVFHFGGNYMVPFETLGLIQVCHAPINTKFPVFLPFSPFFLLTKNKTFKFVNSLHQPHSHPFLSKWTIKAWIDLLQQPP